MNCRVLQLQCIAEVQQDELSEGNGAGRARLHPHLQGSSHLDTWGQQKSVEACADRQRSGMARGAGEWPGCTQRVLAALWAQRPLSALTTGKALGASEAFLLSVKTGSFRSENIAGMSSHGSINGWSFCFPSTSVCHLTEHSPAQPRGPSRWFRHCLLSPGCLIPLERLSSGH